MIFLNSNFKSILQYNKTNSIILVVLLYAICYLFFDITFQHGDDIVMQQIANGTITGKPDSHLVFINSITGYFLKFLYEYNNDIYWYSIIMVALQSLSAVVIVFFVLKKIRKWYVILFTLCFLSYFIINIQFTSITGLLSIAGISLVMQLHEKSPFASFILPFFLFSAAILLRLEMFLFTMAIGIMYILLEYREKRVPILYNRKNYIFGIALAFLLGYSYYFHTQEYSSKEWKYYTEFNKYRSLLNDNPHFTEFAINEADRDNTLRFLLAFQYTSKYNLDYVKQLYREHSIPTAKEYFSTVYHTLLNNKPLWIYLLVIMFAFYIIDKRMYWIPILSFMVITAYIAINLIPKDRVVLPLMFCIFLFSFYKLAEANFKILTLLLSTAISYFLCYLNKKMIHEPAPTENNAFYDIDNYITVDYHFTTNHPFKLNQLKVNTPIYSGWLNNSPLQIEKLKSLGITATVPISLIDNNEVNKKVAYRLMTNDSSILIPLKKYLATENKKLVLIKSNNLYSYYKIEPI